MKGNAMARTATYNFGPGALESLTLKVWTVPNKVTYTDARHLAATLTGTYDVDNGEYTTRVPVSIRTDGWTSEANRHDEVALMVAARTGDDDIAADELAWTLLNWSLDEMTL
jgi:hypothetical protein